MSSLSEKTNVWRKGRVFGTVQIYGVAPKTGIACCHQTNLSTSHTHYSVDIQNWRQWTICTQFVSSQCGLKNGVFNAKFSHPCRQHVNTCLVGVYTGTHVSNDVPKVGSGWADWNLILHSLSDFYVFCITAPLIVACSSDLQRLIKRWEGGTLINKNKISVNSTRPDFSNIMTYTECVGTKQKQTSTARWKAGGNQEIFSDYKKSHSFFGYTEETCLADTLSL